MARNGDIEQTTWQCVHVRAMTTEQFRDFVEGVRADDDAKARPFREYTNRVLEGLTLAVAGRQSAVWCLADVTDADTVSLDVTKLPDDDTTLYTCSLTGRTQLQARKMRCVQITPATPSAHRRGGYVVHREVTVLLEAARAASSVGDYVKTHLEEDAALAQDVRNALRFLELTCKVLSS